ncbi:hypothetical protein [Paraburkholderia kirstenboschensis]
MTTLESLQAKIQKLQAQAEALAAKIERSYREDSKLDGRAWTDYC